MVSSNEDGSGPMERIADQLPKAMKLAVWSGVFAFFTGPAYAQTDSGASCGDMPEQFQELTELLTRIQQLGVALALLIASIMLIYGGILWMRGTPDSQQKARGIIFNTIVGLVIVLMAGGLVEFVKNVLCG